MRAVVQRVKSAWVTVEGELVGEIGKGLLVLLGVGEGDTPSDAPAFARKIAGLRIFPDETGKMSLDVRDVGGSVLVVSQFTLFGDCRKGRRPNFSKAAPPGIAEEAYRVFIANLREEGLPVEEGRFGAMMDVNLVNDGPVTLILDSFGAF